MAFHNARISSGAIQSCESRRMTASTSRAGRLSDSIIVGMVIFSEPTDPVRIICLTLIVAGMVGLKLNSPV
jgi:hypothetical protein